MSSERQVYALYSVESSSRILLPKVFGQCGNSTILFSFLSYILPLDHTATVLLHNYKKFKYLPIIFRYFSQSAFKIYSSSHKKPEMFLSM